MNLIKIKPNTSGTVRDKLCIEDVEIPFMQAVIEFGLVESEIHYDEEVLWFKEPIRVPKFNKFYASRITHRGDPYLLELIRRLMYLNPDPDTLLIKKMAEFIVLRFSKMKMEPSKVKPSEMISKPILKFHEVEAVVIACKLSRGIVYYEPDTEVSVLFGRDTKLTPKQRTAIQVEYRGYMVAEKMASVIHTVTETLIDQQELLKITTTRIKGTELVQTAKGPASLNTIKKYMSDRTLRVIEEHNSAAPFKSQIAHDKYGEFLKYSKGHPLAVLSDALGVSKSTIVTYRTVQEANDLP